MNKTQLLQGTLDLLILRILELGPNHGWGISNRLQQMSKDGLKTSQGSLYPALHRLEMRGEVTSEMTASENNRRARVYTITRDGSKTPGTKRPRRGKRLRCRCGASCGWADDRASRRVAAWAVSVVARLTARSPRSSATTSNARLRRTDRAASRLKRRGVWPSAIWEG